MTVGLALRASRARSPQPASVGATMAARLGMSSPRPCSGGRATSSAVVVSYAIARGRSPCGARWRSGRPCSSSSCTEASRASGRVASTSGTWCRRSGARPRAVRSRSTDGATGEQMVRLGGHVDPVPRAARTTLDGLAVAARARTRPDRRRLARARCPCSGSRAVISARRRAAGLLALALPRVPLARRSRRSRRSTR